MGWETARTRWKKDETKESCGFGNFCIAHCTKIIYYQALHIFVEILQMYVPDNN